MSEALDILKRSNINYVTLANIVQALVKNFKMKK